MFEDGNNFTPVLLYGGFQNQSLTAHLKTLFGRVAGFIPT